MATELERFVSPGKGNGLRATAGIEKGQLAYVAEPLACCVSGKLVRRVCHRCFTRNKNLLRCSQCKMAYYCNTTCQRGAWPVHKRECKCLQSLLPRVPTDSVRLAARLIFALLYPSKSNSEELYTLDEHESHLSSMSEQKKEGLCQLASMLKLYLRPEIPDLSQALALPPSCRDPLSLMAKVTCNCFTVSDAELQETGFGLYPSLSLLNHDCRPNCVRVFEGTKLLLRAVRDIGPAEELTIGYIGTLLLTEKRQEELKDRYYFTCRCQRCESKDEDKLMLSGAESKWCHLKEALPALKGLHLLNDWQPLQEKCSHLLSTVGADVPDENVFKLRITDMALDACVCLGVWEEALRYGEKTLPAYRQYFPDPHPAHGVQLMRIAKLQHYLSRIGDALDTFRQAGQVLNVTHGENHPMVAGVSFKMEECRIEMDQQTHS
ncbi:histone-lysine N-methyltransferase SMYD3 [Brachionichthys hirsutus]|uniref:histone-lysine N-methyltransferase SMYD3 n=1 Tax=Brachionichthys hirsutus TaxID=412623 RepID=UPI003604F0DB